MHWAKVFEKMKCMDTSVPKLECIIIMGDILALCEINLSS